LIKKFVRGSNIVIKMESIIDIFLKMSQMHILYQPALLELFMHISSTIESTKIFGISNLKFYFWTILIKHMFI